ncbi:MAG: hypothetical protein GY699_13675 [Desulfobacteraceae bacterium]|nr:hypothetical protein [Desulfobacteraceae bacterium]
MPEMQHVHLMKFKPEELIFDEGETKDVLTFFYPNQGAFIGKAVINDDVRGFAQALMVEAVDASYALGYVKIVFDVFYMKPPVKFGKALAKFGKKAAPHWFKHATATDLTNAKIYDSVRGSIARNFRSDFEYITSGGSAMNNKRMVAVIAYSKVNDLNQKIVWSWI